MYFLNNFFHRVINFCFRSTWFRLKLITKITIDTVFLAPHSIMFGTSTTKESISIFGHFLDLWLQKNVSKLILVFSFLLHSYSWIIYLVRPPYLSSLKEIYNFLQNIFYIFLNLLPVILKNLPLGRTKTQSFSYSLACYSLRTSSGRNKNTEFFMHASIFYKNHHFTFLKFYVCR